MSVTLNYVNIILNLGISLSPFPTSARFNARRKRIDGEANGKTLEAASRYKVRRKRGRAAAKTLRQRENKQHVTCYTYPNT